MFPPPVVKPDELIVIAPPNVELLSKVTSNPRAVTFVVNAMVLVPESVTAPPAVRVRLPLIVDAARSNAPVSLKTAFSALTTVTEPPKLFALSRVMFPGPAVMLVVPVIAKVPVSVTSPAAVRIKLREIVDVPANSTAVASFKVISRPLTT